MIRMKDVVKSYTTGKVEFQALKVQEATQWAIARARELGKRLERRTEAHAFGILRGSYWLPWGIGRAGGGKQRH